MAESSTSLDGSRELGDLSLLEQSELTALFFSPDMPEDIKGPLKLELGTRFLNWTGLGDVADVIDINPDGTVGTYGVAVTLRPKSGVDYQAFSSRVEATNQSWLTPRGTVGDSRIISAHHATGTSWSSPDLSLYTKLSAFSDQKID